MFSKGETFRTGGKTLGEGQRQTRSLVLDRKNVEKKSVRGRKTTRGGMPLSTVSQPGSVRKVCAKKGRAGTGEKGGGGFVGEGTNNFRAFRFGKKCHIILWRVGEKKKGERRFWKG